MIQHHLGMDPLSIKPTSNSWLLGVFLAPITSLQGPIKTKEQAW
jgi:hypothetical protein